MAAAFDAVADHYDDFYSTRADLAESALVFGRAQARFESNPVPGQFIDLGCGPGTALRWLTVSPGRYLGVDISELAIQRARSLYASAGYRFQVGDEEELESGLAAFVLGGFGPLQYVDSLARFSTHVRRILVPGGRFLIMGRPRMAATRVLASDALTRPYSAAQVRERFSWAEELEVYGLRRWTPRWLPVRTQIRLMTCEHVMRPKPDRCEWLIVEGRRASDH